jgi:hypothetical protein
MPSSAPKNMFLFVLFIKSSPPPNNVVRRGVKSFSRWTALFAHSPFSIPVWSF